MGFNNPLLPPLGRDAASMPPSLMPPEPAPPAAVGGLAQEESGGLSKFIGSAIRGFNRVMSSPAYMRLWNAAVGGMTGDPSAGPRMLREMSGAPTLQDEIARLRLRQLEREESEKESKTGIMRQMLEAASSGNPELARQLAIQLDPQGYAQSLIKPPAEAKAPTQRKRSLPDGTVQQEEFVNGQWQPVGQPGKPASLVNVNTSEGPKLTDVRGLRTDYANEAARFRTAVEQLPMMRASAAMGTGAGDLGLIVAVAKIRDPQSVVREGEVELVREDKSRVEEIRLAVKRWKDSGILLPEQRKRLVESIEAEVRSLAPAEEQRRKSYGAIATQYGIDPTFIYGQPSVEDQLRAAGLSGAMGAAPASGGASSPGVPAGWSVQRK